jgi:pimeloyl-ACP methyl ester carboxylesterase
MSRSHAGRHVSHSRTWSAPLPRQRRERGGPREEGTYRDARAARTALLDRPGLDAGRVLYLAESLGGAVALALALGHRPRGLILQLIDTAGREMTATQVAEGVVLSLTTRAIDTLTFAGGC